MPKIKDDFSNTLKITTFKSEWSFTKAVTIDVGSSTSDPGLVVSGNKNQIEFNGDISATYGTAIEVTGSGNSIHFGTDALVGSTQGIIASHATKITNDGHMSAGYLIPGFAFTGSSENDKFINHGTVYGSISLNAGDDIIDARHGSISQTIYGGTGDDVLITANSAVFLTENANEGFFDTVKSTVHYQLNDNVEKLVLLGKKNLEGAGNEQSNYMNGNSGNNILHGNGGLDNLFGHKGNDKLYGDAGDDYFYFKTGDGKDTIMDFVQGPERINLREWNNVDSFSDVKRHASDHGADVWIEIGRDTIIIKDMHKAELNVLDFLV